MFPDGTKYQIKYSFLLLFPIGEVHAEEDEGRAEEEPNGDLLVEQPPGKEDGGDGIEVNPVGGDDGTQLTDDPVPDEETDHGGHNTQEQQVPKHLRAQDDLQGRKAGKDQIVGEYCQQTVEEHLSRDKKGGIAFGDRFHQQGVDGPAQTGAKGQDVAQG